MQMEAGISEIQGHPQLISQFEISLIYMRLLYKNKYIHKEKGSWILVGGGGGNLGELGEGVGRFFLFCLPAPKYPHQDFLLIIKTQSILGLFSLSFIT